MINRKNSIKDAFRYHFNYIIYALTFRNFISTKSKVYRKYSFIIPSILGILIFFLDLLLYKNLNPYFVCYSAIKTIVCLLFYTYLLPSFVYDNIPIQYKFNEIHFTYIFTAAIIYLPLLQIIFYFFRINNILKYFIIIIILYSMVITINLYKSISQDGIDRFSDYCILFGAVSLIVNSLFLTLVLMMPYLFIIKGCFISPKK